MHVLAEAVGIFLLLSGTLGGIGIGYSLGIRKARIATHKIFILITIASPSFGVFHMSLLLLERWLRWQYALEVTGMQIEFSLYPITVAWVGIASTVWWAITLPIAYLFGTRFHHNR